MKKWISMLCAIALLLASLTGCSDAAAPSAAPAASPSASAEDGGDAAETAEESAETTETAVAFVPQTDADMFTDRDTRATYDEAESVQISLDGDSITASSDSVQVNGTTAILTAEGTYVLSGTLRDGMIVVNADESAKVQIVLNGADITSSTSAALYVLEADKVVVTLAEGTENTLSNGGTFTAIDESNIDGAVYSKQDLTFNGAGSLTVTSPAGHGIVGNDDLVLTGGTYAIASASHGLKANDSVRITGETSLQIDSGKDGIHAENSDDAELGFVYISGGDVSIEAEGDGISASAYLQITDGTYDILAGGGSANGESHASSGWGGFRGARTEGTSAESEETEDEESTSMKGLKAGSALAISGGTFTLDAADDAVHSNAALSIDGGTFDIATGDDAFHADDTLTVTDGTIRISESYEGLEALHLLVSGGDISIVSSDDGLNAAGGTDGSGTSGGRDGMFGGGQMPARPEDSAPSGDTTDTTPPDRPETASDGTEERPEAPQAMDGAPDAGRGGRGGMGGMGGGFSSNSDGTIVISGGTLTIQASGDGIDANGSLEITGGTTVVSGPTQGDTSTLDFDTTGTISGGTFIGTGATNMAQTFTDAGQGVVTERVSGAAGSVITLSDAAGNVLLTSTPALDFQLVILSCPDLVSGETYTLTVGDTSMEVQAS